MNLEDLNASEPWHLRDRFSEARYHQMANKCRGSSLEILDVGVGSGIGGSVLKKHFPESKVYGIDIVEERTRGCLDFYEEVRYESATSTSFHDNFFDFVVAGEIIEHLPVGEVNNFLCEMFRILKIGGIFVITTPNPRDIKALIRGNSVLGGSHLSQHFITATKMRLRMNGFRVKNALGTGRTSTYLGPYLPKFLYGSYMLVSCKK